MTKNMGHAWNTTTEYPSLTSDLFLNDKDTATLYIDKIEQLSKLILDIVNNSNAMTSQNVRAQFATCYQALELSQEVDKLLANLFTFVHCELSIDGQNDSAKQARSIIEPMYARYSQILEPFSQFLMRINQNDFDAFFENKKVAGDKFRFSFERRERHALLPLEHEQLLMAMGTNGFNAWGNLYDSVTATLRCELNLPDGKKTLGVAELSGYLQNANEEIRKNAWDARNQMWESQQDTCAAALNAIAGWRIESNKLRSGKKTVDFLDNPLHKNRICKETLDAMLGAVEDRAHVVRPAFKAIAKALGKSKLDAWDLSAPPPKRSQNEKQEFSYEMGIEIVTQAFDGVDTQMGAFVRMMEEQKWIEGRVLPSKRHGAYCTSFAKSQTPRVFMTYQGTMSNITTLAHELGHALHYWVIRDLPEGERSVPMTLAETASVFAETVTREALQKRASSPYEQFESAWYDAQAAVVFLLNIPGRFEFEKNFYEQRKQRELSASELRDLVTQCMQRHYGPDVDMKPSYMMWTSTLHYYITELSFYNFPYTFGYLFALGIYAQWQKLGNQFYPKYVDILRDTGRMSPEDLIQKHLEMDITKKEFWYDSLSIVDGKIKNFQKLTDELFGKV